MADKIYQNWKLALDDNKVLQLTLDRQGSAVNSLNREVFKELDDILNTVSQDKSITAMVIRSGKTSGFIAGADIEQFIHLQDQEEAYELVRQAQIILDKLAALPFPTIAAIDGFCLGGGLELALACDYRIATEESLIGAPEVKLGLQPGWGGTVRLPRLVGVLNAMQMNLTGRSVNAKTAAKMGVIDAVVPKRQFERAINDYALKKPSVHRPSAWQNLLNLKLIRPFVAKKLHGELTKKVSKEHYPAPYAIVANWEKNGAIGDGAFIDEAESISHLLMTDTSRNLVRDFFLQTRLKSFGKEIKFKPQHVHVIGAGVMGAGIAALCALRGYHVTLQDRAPDYIAPAIKSAYEWFKKALKQPRLIQAAMDRLMPDVDGLGLSKADIVIEAISENLHQKQALYKAIEPKLKADAILATNTSSLPLDKLDKVLQHPERLVGLHFFNPVSIMQLVEVVRGQDTSSEVFQKALAFVRSLDRLPLPVISSPGFLVNRILMPYLMEAMVLLEEGVAAEVIDKKAVEFGMPMGPIELADTVGLDVCLSVAEILSGYYGDHVPERLREMVDKGELGRKTGKGFYTYQKAKLVKPVSTMAETSADFESVTDRLILRMVNEAIKCLGEEVVEDADLVDAGMIFGTGFAPFRGGPLHYAKSQGVNVLINKLRDLQDKYGDRFKPDPAWKLLQTQSHLSIVE